MPLSIHCQPLVQTTVDVLLVPVFTEDVSNSGSLNESLPSVGERLSAVLGTAEMMGKSGQLLTLHLTPGLYATRLVLMGVGAADKLTTQTMRESVAAAIRAHGMQGARRFGLLPRWGALPPQSFVQAAVIGAHLATFPVDCYRTEDTRPVQVETLTVVTETADDAIHEGIRRGSILGEAINFARFLVNEPANRMTPTHLAHHAQEMANDVGLQTDILNEDKMRDLGMEALLAVARGSVEEPRLITVRYSPPNGGGRETIGLIGKGITFDTGGISLKPAENMEKMKYDMAGGAAVLGAMRAIAQLKPNLNVIGIVPSCENMPSGKATRPGDVVRTMLGKTVEIINTDAEGRLILCDAMAYARRLGVTCMVDLATLTGAIAVALGLRYAGLFSHHPNMVEELQAAARAADERVWPLPLDDEYRELIKSDIADIKNVGGKYGGSITAAWFLREFAGDVPWAHLDIANIAWNMENKPHLPKGPTGFGVGTLVEFVLARAHAANGTPGS